MKRGCNPYLSSITEKKMFNVYIHHAVITIYVLKSVGMSYKSWRVDDHLNYLSLRWITINNQALIWNNGLWESRVSRSQSGTKPWWINKKEHQFLILDLELDYWKEYKIVFITHKTKRSMPNFNTFPMVLLRTSFFLIIYRILYL